VGYESWLERDQVMWLDWDQTVTGIASQSFRLWWTAGEGKTPSHVPDYFAERAGGPAWWSTAGLRTALLPGTWPRSRQLARHAPWPGGSTGWSAPWTRLPRRTCGGWPGTRVELDNTRPSRPDQPGEGQHERHVRRNLQLDEIALGVLFGEGFAVRMNLAIRLSSFG
jgi:hypothetical protein